MVIVAWLLGHAALSPAADVRFQLEFPTDVRSEPFTGRVCLFFSRTQSDPRAQLDWFKPEPFVGLDVADWRPGTPLAIAADTPGLMSFPKPLAETDLSGFKVQAVARFNAWERNVGTGAGNGYGDAVALPPTASEPVRLTINHLVPEPPSVETAWLKLCEVRSELLSRFHHRDVMLRASVQLPAGYHTDTDRRYPVVFTIPGFGGTHRPRNVPVAPPEPSPYGVEFLHVQLDPSCPWGHHVFADSDTNGPWGTAFVTEWLPEFERRFRTVAQPHGRLLTGHSSGGWSSLWVQITHPELFGGVWSTAPDSVDFRDFQQANIYRTDENAYADPAGQRRPIARLFGQPVVWWDDFDRMEQTLGPGGQLRSFDAVFSPRGKDGCPQPLWDRPTGRIDPAVAKTWERYDIRLVLERNWDRLGPRLAGKLRVFMGDQDTFYLNGATVLLKESLEKLGSDAVVEIHAGKDHSTLMTPELRDRIRREMAERYKMTDGQ